MRVCLMYVYQYGRITCVSLMYVHQYEKKLIIDVCTPV